MNYEEYIKTEQWNQKRNERMKMDNNTCQTCISKENLECHHKNYDNLFNENVEHDLITLCNPCHDAITSSMRERRYNLIPILCNDNIRVTPLKEVTKEVENYGLEKDKIRDWKRVSPTRP